jgi:hypothetical protein
MPVFLNVSNNEASQQANDASRLVRAPGTNRLAEQKLGKVPLGSEWERGWQRQPKLKRVRPRSAVQMSRQIDRESKQAQEEITPDMPGPPARGGSEWFRSPAQSQQAVAPRTISPGRADFSPGPADLVCDVVQVAPLAQLACHPLALPGHLAQRHEDRQDHAARHKVQVLRWDH